MPIDKILMQIKDDHALKWPKRSINFSIKTMGITWRIAGI